MKPCLLGLIVLLCAVFSVTDTTNAAIIVTPSVVVALINHSTIFNCSTTSMEVEWLSESASQPIIFSYGEVKEPYKDLFRVETHTQNNRKFFNIILHSVRKDDAGRYICRDPDSPNEEGKEVHLTVLETQPFCEPNLNVDRLIGPNSCGMKPDTVQLSCSVRYSGNQAPELQWIKTGENITINSSKCLNSGNVYTCNVTMESELQMEGSSYVCQTTQSMTKQYKCSSDVFRVMYVLSEPTELTRAVNDKVNCSFNFSSQSCTSSWIFDNGTTNRTESHERVIEFKRPGRFICQANCLIRNNNCTLTIMTVTVSAKPEGDGIPIVGIVVGVVVAVSVIAICVGLIIFFCLWYKRRQNGQNNPAQAEHMLRIAEHDGVILNEQNPPERAEPDGGDQILRTIEPMIDENRNSRVRGLTILNDELFVAFEISDIIEIFPIDISALNRSSKVDDLRDPGTIAACTTNNCLYIVDQRRNNIRKKIFKVKPDGTVIGTWETEEGDRGRISVNRDGNVVMTVYDKHKLKIYSPEGILLTEKTIDLSQTSIAYIYHAINLANGNFILCHGMRAEESKLHRVCKIDATGNVLQSFGKEKGSDNAHLSSPVYLVERNDGSILVADQGNHRIILLSSQLKFVKELFTKENGNVNLPEAIYIYEKTEPSLLFLGCNETSKSGGYVLVLRLGQ